MHNSPLTATPPHRRPGYGLLLAIVVLLVIAAVANSVMDTIAFHYEGSYLPQTEAAYFLWGDRAYWDNAMSWKAKYTDWPQDKSAAYPGAKTWLVWTTDGWHLMQMIMLTALQLAIALPVRRLYRLPWIGVFVLVGLMKVIYGVSFELFWA